MTPFKKAGYTKDTKFRVLIDYGSFVAGDIVTLLKDLGHSVPFFIAEDGRRDFMCLPGSPFAEELEVYKGD